VKEYLSRVVRGGHQCCFPSFAVGIERWDVSCVSLMKRVIVWSFPIQVNLAIHIKSQFNQGLL